MYLKPKVNLIKQERINANLSQHKLSLIAGLGGNSINRIESGETVRIHPLRAREIARALNCKVRDIFDEI